MTQSGDIDSIRTGNTAVGGSGLDKWTNINRFSYGAGLGLGVQLWALQVTAQYTWNFGKLSNFKDTCLNDFNDKNFGGYVVSVALMFGKKKNKQQ